MQLKLRGGIWYAFWTEAGKTKRVSLKTRDKAVAEQRLAEGRSRPVETATTADLVNAYLHERRGKIVAYRRREEAAAPIQAFFGHMMPADVTQATADAYGAYRNVSSGTLRLELGLLRTVFNWAEKHRYIGAKPYFELPPTAPPTERWLSPDEAKRLLLACDGHVKLFTLLCLHTGCRKKSALELRWTQVDFTRRQIDFGKGTSNKRRGKPPISDALYDILVKAHRIAASPFVIEYRGRPMEEMRNAFQDAVTRAGLSGVTPKVLRHTFISWAVQEGKYDLFRIAEFVGHADTEMISRVYGHLHPEHLRDVAGVAERALK